MLGRSCFALFIVVALLSNSVPLNAADPADQFPGLNLVPWPKSVKVEPNDISINENSQIVALDEELKPLGKLLSNEMHLLTGRSPAVASGPGRPGDIILHIDKTLKADVPLLTVHGSDVVKTTDGAHTIVINDRATIEGFDYRAVAEGTSTLLQAISQKGGKYSLPKLTIKDWPYADYCGMMVDVGRQDHPIAALKEMVEVCRLYKVRYLQLHLTDDQGWTFPSTKYPQLGSKNYGAHGGIAPKVYTLAELKDLVAYADARGIAIVPEMEVPGHSGAALRSFPEVFDAINPANGQPVELGCMNMANEELYTVLDTVIGEMSEVFKSSPYFHIGSDEVSPSRVPLYTGYKPFMEKHQLKNEDELAVYFVKQVAEMVKRHGKKPIKWEGLANEASKDIVIMAWNANSNTASEMIAQGYTVITCPWNLEVPWEQWSLFVCNGSRLKPSDPVLGATLVAWEQPPAVHLAGVRNVGARQERTWGPENTPTVAGFAVRSQAVDAIAAKLIQMPPKTRIGATFTEPAGNAGFQTADYALDGSDDTFYLGARALKKGEAFTAKFDKPQLVYEIDALTGANGHGELAGELQAETNGTFHTVGRFEKGTAHAILGTDPVTGVRIVAAEDQAEPLALREIKLRLMTEVSGKIMQPTRLVGAGNVALLTGDTTFGPNLGASDLSILNKGFTLHFEGGKGRAIAHSGAILGSGKTEFTVGFGESAMTLTGKAPNSTQGTYLIRQGEVRLEKEAGADALGGTIVVGDETGHLPTLIWLKPDQINDAAKVTLGDAIKSTASLMLNGFSEAFDTLQLTTNAKVDTGGGSQGGVVRVKHLIVNGKSMGKGIYTSAEPWIIGSGFIVVGETKYVDVSGTLTDAGRVVGSGNIAVVRKPTTLAITGGETAVPFKLASADLSIHLSGNAPASFSGFVTGSGGIDLMLEHEEAAKSFAFTGASSNSYSGPTRVLSGVLELHKSDRAIAIPGDLILEASKNGNGPVGVTWAADGQVAPSSNITLKGDGDTFLNLADHHVRADHVAIGASGKVITGTKGMLICRQLFIDGKRVADGEYNSRQPWIAGDGRVFVNCTVDVKGTYGNPDEQIGKGNVARLTGDAEFSYPASEIYTDVDTNGLTLTLDSGDGNAFCYHGSLSGSGNVNCLMGPSHTGFKDAPMRLSGDKPNTATGTLFVRKGVVQLEKPAGVDAIAGDVIVGGQGFNDCLLWMKDDQVKDSSHIVLLDTPNNGAGYLNLNGCSEHVESVTMTANNIIKTEGNGKAGTLTVRSLTIAGVAKPAGEYTAGANKWIEGAGKVVIQQ